MTTGSSQHPPQQQKRSFALIAAIGMALAALVILNVAQHRLDPKVQQQLAEEAQQKAAAEAQKKAEKEHASRSGTGGKPGAGASTDRANQLVAMGTTVTLGPPSSSTEITVGWEWTPAVQGDPSSIAATGEALQNQFPGATIRLVNVDADPTQTPGVSVNGKLVTEPAPDGTLNTAQIIERVKAVPGVPTLPPAARTAPQQQQQQQPPSGPPPTPR